ncbi:MAG: hypothetical protein J6L96_09530 [Clostridia bacterium]|nr:hypothetical protein [Clostridia bacterium]
MRSLVEKTNDVKYTPDILKILGAETILYYRGYNILDYLTVDEKVLERRSKMFVDTASINGLDKLLNDAIKMLDHIYEMIRLQNSVTDSERGLYSVKELELYFEVIDKLAAFFDENNSKFTSGDYIEWFNEVSFIKNSDEYAKLKDGTAKLLSKISNVKSISIGFNFDASFAPYESGILSVNDRYVKSGALIDRILRADVIEGDPLLSIAPLVAPKRVCGEWDYEILNGALYSALNKIFKREIKQWEPELDKYLKDHIDFLIAALPDMKFIASGTKIISNMRKLKLNISKPVYRPMEEKAFRAVNLYNPVLAINMALSKDKKEVVKNDLTFDENGRIFLLTGANNGGKSVYMCAVGLIQIMAQVGLPVPASKLEISPVSGIFIELPGYRSINQDGRLVEECKKIQSMFAEVDEYSLILLDELFSSTDPLESVTLSGEVLRAISYIGARGIYTTHFHALSEDAEGINSDENSKSKIDHLVAEVAEGTMECTYKINRRSPDGKSYAKNIANKYGISCEGLIGK